ncbi:hypothetical protein Q6348_12770 [Isoptericola sp. b441]|uniref:Uncharacterized protein n=1 Tax=Actinotalea lenta TaxID=3064654 RepID=A0ABT9DCN7_9CELL|nr:MULTISPECIES: hypothetical protein [unclassified Isoptericola]MDO8108069.1 hypothetical protein [Isoptericola sp. b441]MDO8120262.1 hypothetical protein [Isoptericola sp. b490]
MILTALGAVGTLGGAVAFVLAFRRGQADDHVGERRLFRWAVAGMALGMLLFAAALLTAPHGG